MVNAMLRAPGLFKLVVLVPAVGIGTAGAQDSTRAWQPIPILAAGLHVTSEPRGHSAMVLGASMTFERTMGDRAAIRPFVSAYRHQLGSAGNALSIEYPDFPHHELAAGLDGLFRPFVDGPSVLLGGGVTWVLGSSKPYYGSPVADTTIGPRLMLRGGLEVAIGRSRRAPRVHYVRNVYAGSFLAAKWLDTIALLLPL
jgi:hypothetical protein